jgi:5-methylcytosine-specific restriction enzyme subunit McrC
VHSRRPPFARLAVDAKYKLYDQQKVSPADVYQSFLYAYAFSRGEGAHGSLPMALIIYPSGTRAPKSVGLRVRGADNPVGAEIIALGVSIPGCLSEVKTGASSATLSRFSDALDLTLSLGLPAH